MTYYSVTIIPFQNSQMGTERKVVTNKNKKNSMHFRMNKFYVFCDITQMKILLSYDLVNNSVPLKTPLLPDCLVRQSRTTQSTSGG